MSRPSTVRQTDVPDATRSVQSTTSPRTSKRFSGSPTARLVDRDAAAARLGASARHVRRLVQERRIPYYRIGGKVRFSPVELEAWVDSMAIRPRARVRDFRR
jgi:excisionase family DNA binding protein